MFIPDVLNTLLLGLILLVIVATVVRPIFLNLVLTPGREEQLRRQVEHSVQHHLNLQFDRAASERLAQSQYQRLLLDAPAQPPSATADEADWLPEEEPIAGEGATGSLADGEGDAAGDASALGEGEIEVREGESLADIKERLKREQQQAKKPVIPPELLQGANSYEDKVGVVRMVGQNDQARVANLIRSMVQSDLA